MDQARNKLRNRRRSIRRQARRTTKVTLYRGPMGLGSNLAIKILDLSETGTRLLIATELTQREEVEINLLGMGQARPVRLPAEVVWCIETKEGEFCVGIQFRRPLNFRDLQGM